jgi:hypothetical protein
MTEAVSHRRDRCVSRYSASASANRRGHASPLVVSSDDLQSRDSDDFQSGDVITEVFGKFPGYRGSMRGI